MKNKKVLSVIIGISCVAILIGTIALNQKQESEFIPEVTETTVDISWEEKHLQTIQEQTTQPEIERVQTGPTGSIEDLTQVMVTETSDEIITDLTPSVQKEQIQADTKPKSPPTKSEIKEQLPSPDAQKNTSAPQAEAPPESQPASEQSRKSVSEDPSQGNSGHEGQVYDPVFGWVTPSPMQGQVIDNDRDINEQVGTMN